MLNAVQKHVAEATTAIFAAAVADFRQPGRCSQDQENWRRIHAAAGKSRHSGTIAGKGERLIVGFAAETDKVAENARKIEEKDADLIVANDVTAAGAGSMWTRT
jgi:phosphopantothenoylcysteine decarboxylase/phosphopantothenate--cysteine ligase